MSIPCVCVLLSLCVSCVSLWLWREPLSQEVVLVPVPFLGVLLRVPWCQIRESRTQVLLYHFRCGIVPESLSATDGVLVVLFPKALTNMPPLKKVITLCATDLPQFTQNNLNTLIHCVFSLQSLLFFPHWEIVWTIGGLKREKPNSLNLNLYRHVWNRD